MQNIFNKSGAFVIRYTEGVVPVQTKITLAYEAFIPEDVINQLNFELRAKQFPFTIDFIDEHFVINYPGSSTTRTTYYISANGNLRKIIGLYDTM